jgi:hypothetical protein
VTKAKKAPTKTKGKSRSVTKKETKSKKSQDVTKKDEKPKKRRFGGILGRRKD